LGKVRANGVDISADLLDLALEIASLRAWFLVYVRQKVNKKAFVRQLSWSGYDMKLRSRQRAPARV
jgi:hypothetical protein